MTSKTINPETSNEISASLSDSEIRNRMISEAAYYRAEARGFKGDGALKDWLEAECEVDAFIEKNNGKAIQVV